jgi:hypothetical protein
MKKANIFKRILLIDKYKSNYDYSFKKNAKRSFSYIRPSFLDKFDSFYAVKVFDIKDKKIEFEKWTLEVKNES